MIGSPWNPFFQQSLPTQYGRYDGALLPPEFEPRQLANQLGAMDHPSVPTYLQIKAPGADRSSQPLAILERTYAMRSEEDLAAAVWASALPGIFGTRKFTDIFGTMFLWYFSQFSLFSGRMLWQSPVDEHGYRWFFGSAFHHPAAYGFLSDNGYWEGMWEWSGPLREHDNFQGQGQGVTVDWNRFYSLWYSDGLPSATDGTDGTFEHPAFPIANETYPVYVPFHRTVAASESGEKFTVISRPNSRNDDIRFGMRVASAIDLNRDNSLQLLTLPAPHFNTFRIALSPWYHGAATDT